MKIGIITLLGNNYGNRLQNYAVQEILKKYGEVYTVPYEKKNQSVSKKSVLCKCNPFYVKKAVDSRLLNIYHLSNRKMNTISRTSFFLKHRDEIKKSLKKRNQAFAEFDAKYIIYELEKLHLQGDDCEPWVEQYDAWVCGSDQIWNPHYPTATRNAFLQFAPQERRIALSASIGLSDVTEMPDEYKVWMKEIPYLSVRENEAADIVHTLTGRKAEVFLDPTMILPKQKWEYMAEQVERKLPDKFALNYFLGIKEKDYAKFIDRDIKKRGLERVDMLNGEYSDYMDLSPDEVIGAIKNAEIIYTDSFHGVVFSIIFHKQFIVFERSEEGKSMNSRLLTLLKKFGMQDRVYNKDNTLALNEQIDYSKTDKIISEEQIRVQNFLDHAMKQIGNLEKKVSNNTNKYIQITRKEHCFGCTACYSVCPKQCIIMTSDKEGFTYPEIDFSECINCGKCSSVCPYNNRNGNEIQEVYAAINQNSEVRSNSSSGGTFYNLCKLVLEEQKGVVYGCAWSDDMVARHYRAETMDEARKFQGSKYVQSNLGDTFNSVKKDLKQEKFVMYSGTPCQIAGLKNYLGKEYDNLLLIDVLCHGVPSPKVLKEYLTLREKKQNSKVVDMNLRDKKKSWHRLHTNIKFLNGSQHYVFCGYDTYMSLFLKNMGQRPSCFECKFTTGKRQGDITLGDFWGIGTCIYEMDDDKGTSMVAVNTDKGQYAWEKIKQDFIVRKADYKMAEAGNKVLSEPPKKHPNRDAFYRTFSDEGYEKAVEKWVEIPGKGKQLYYDIMRKGLDLYRTVRRIKY